MRSRAPYERPSGTYRTCMRAGVLILASLTIVAIVFLVRGLVSGEKYESEIVFDPKFLENRGPATARSYQDSRMPVIKSQPVLEDAIRISGFDDLDFVALYQGLELKKTDRGILVGFESNDAERSRKIVHSVIEAYNAFDSRLARKKSDSSRKKR